MNRINHEFDALITDDYAVEELTMEEITMEALEIAEDLGLDESYFWESYEVEAFMEPMRRSSPRDSDWI